MKTKQFSKHQILDIIKNKLIVSCQAVPGDAFYGHVALFAKAALDGGAVAIRANTVRDINSISEAVNCPVIGLYKKDYPENSCYITPTLKEVRELVSMTSCDVVAVDATDRIHPEGQNGAEFIRQIKAEFSDLVLMADISTLSEGIEAERAGADILSTTLSGYTDYSPNSDLPDFSLIKALADNVNIPVIAEGRIWQPADLQKAMKLGAYSAVIGSAITRPHEITKRFVRCLTEKCQ